MHGRFRRLLISLFLLHGSAPAAQDDTVLTDGFLQHLRAAEGAISGITLPSVNSMKAPETDATIRRLSHEIQDLGVQRSVVGDTDGAIDAFDMLGRANASPRSDEKWSVPDGVRTEDAIHAIVEQARSKRVVLINEAHHVPMNRAFTQKLAAELRKIGYSYLACETFTSDKGSVPGVESGRVTLDTGYYTRDPVFADFVDAALADGWKLVPYDDDEPPKSGEDLTQRFIDREQAQARHLVERIFNKDKNAKVLIHVGYHHLLKSTLRDKNMPVLMGEYLHRMTGLEMLHVDQTLFYAHPDHTRETPLYAALVDTFPSTEPFVLRTQDGRYPVLLGMDGHVDMQVIFPRYVPQDGRPAWLRTIAGRIPHSIPADLLPVQGRRLIKAVRVDAVKGEIPADMVLVEAGKPMPVLMLPPGKFRYTYEAE
ncbi:hypothetical protein [Massilia sp. 9096]|uniref:hypothetical protein n=1 Tax=Massilia sp. 9096 TaxID=1500894 RepID=UPI0012E04809|nr:hypothetical protein [Massilia sp. 9096]